MDTPGPTTASHSFSCNRKRVLFILLWAAVFLLGLYVRMSGLFRGAGEPVTMFHPDEAKQIGALFNFLHGTYVRYFGDLFYDGYPFGLNHLDEYILRPILFFFGVPIPSPSGLYPYTLLLRTTYGMAVLVITYFLVSRLTGSRHTGVLAMFLLAISPLSITVSHFATGDIGVDLFTALSLLFLLLYNDHNRNPFYLLATGIGVGAAFSAKYNGLLIGLMPVMILFFHYLRDKKISSLTVGCLLSGLGTLSGILLFTPHLLADFHRSLVLILANFDFIKNYNVPAEILAKPGLEKAILGIQQNSLYIIGSLGYTACFTPLILVFMTGRKYVTTFYNRADTQQNRTIFLLSLALSPLFALLISLSGKYIVQPFHFSYLEVPLIVAASVVCATFFNSPLLLLRACGLIIIALICFEFGRVSLRDNFFWRLEDNVIYEHALSGSIFTLEAQASREGDAIRSLYLEPPGNAIFRNMSRQASGVDAPFWKSIRVAPLPQVANPVGNDWIFVNGPTFPRNDRMFPVRGGSHGATVTRFLVLPRGKPFPGLGIRNGSYATKVSITLGGVSVSTAMEPHEQQTLSVLPGSWMMSGTGNNGDQQVRIIPLEVTVPHGDIWLTVLTSEKEQQLYTLFGGGQDGPLLPPEAMGPELKKQYVKAVGRIRYLDRTVAHTLEPGNPFSLSQLALPAGRYLLTGEVEGLSEQTTITLWLEDARGGVHRGRETTIQVGKGMQKLHYAFSKPFVPYQGRLMVGVVSGRCRLLSFTLTPDYRGISDDFERWRTNDVQPEWLSRYGK